MSDLGSPANKLGTIYSSVDTGKALQSNASTGGIEASAVTTTELGYVSGVTSAIQTQINATATTASPTFTGTVTMPVLDITNTTNQLVLGTTHTTTISSTAPAASRTYTIPDAGGSANVLLDKGNYTLSGTWTNAQLVTPALGTPSAGVLTSCTALPLTSGVTGVLAIANGGTNSAASLTGGRVMVSTASAVIEQSGSSADDAVVALMNLFGSNAGQVRFNAYSTTGISNTAKEIYAPANDGCTLVMVAGTNGSVNFTDLLLTGFSYSGAVTPFASLNEFGSPAVRTYSMASNVLKVAMASGTYTTRVFAIEFNTR